MLSVIIISHVDVSHLDNQLPSLINIDVTHLCNQLPSLVNIDVTHLCDQFVMSMYLTYTVVISIYLTCVISYHN